MQQQPTSHRRVLFKDTLPFCRYFTFFTLVNFETSSSSHTYVPEPFFTLPSHYPRVLDPLRCSQYLTVQADSSRHACTALNVSFADASQSHPHTPAYFQKMLGQKANSQYGRCCCFCCVLPFWLGSRSSVVASRTAYLFCILISMRGPPPPFFPLPSMALAPGSVQSKMGISKCRVK